MPTLPTLTVTDAQANRMLAAWGSTGEYTNWLQDQIIEYVLRYEKRQRLANFDAQEKVAEQEARTSLLGS